MEVESSARLIDPVTRTGSSEHQTAQFTTQAILPHPIQKKYLYKHLVVVALTYALYPAEHAITPFVRIPPYARSCGASYYSKAG